MKIFKKTALLLCSVLLISFSSCSSDDDGGSGNASPSGVITAKVDGTAFTSLEITSVASQVTAGPNTTVTIQGNSSTQAFNLIINGFEGVGTYVLSDDNVFISASYIEPNVNDPQNSQTWNAPYQDSGVVGEIKVSSDSDDNIVGTFYFTCKNANDGSTKNITEGTFNLEKQIF